MRIGRLSRKLVWDREGALHAGGGRPTEAFASFLGQLALGWISLAPRDPKAKGIEERGHRFLRTSFEPAHLFAGPGDFQEQFDDWYEGRANIRFHRGIRARPVEERLTAARAARHGAGQKIDDPMSPVSRGIRADGPWRSARAATTSCRIFLNA